MSQSYYEWILGLNAPPASGAIDAIAVRKHDGNISQCSPFHVRMIKDLKNDKELPRSVQLKVNGIVNDSVAMRLGPAGEAFFVERLGVQSSRKRNSVALPSSMSVSAELPDRPSDMTGSGSAQPAVYNPVDEPSATCDESSQVPVNDSLLPADTSEACLTNQSTEEVVGLVEGTKAYRSNWTWTWGDLPTRAPTSNPTPVMSLSGPNVHNTSYSPRTQTLKSTGESDLLWFEQLYKYVQEVADGKNLQVAQGQQPSDPSAPRGVPFDNTDEPVLSITNVMPISSLMSDPGLETYALPKDSPPRMHCADIMDDNHYGLEYRPDGSVPSSPLIARGKSNIASSGVVNSSEATSPLNTIAAGDTSGDTPSEFPTFYGSNDECLGDQSDSTGVLLGKKPHVSINVPCKGLHMISYCGSQLQELFCTPQPSIGTNASTHDSNGKAAASNIPSSSNRIDVLLSMKVMYLLQSYAVTDDEFRSYAFMDSQFYLEDSTVIVLGRFLLTWRVACVAISIINASSPVCHSSGWKKDTSNDITEELIQKAVSAVYGSEWEELKKSPASTIPLWLGYLVTTTTLPSQSAVDVSKYVSKPLRRAISTSALSDGPPPLMSLDDLDQEDLDQECDDEGYAPEGNIMSLSLTSLELGVIQDKCDETNSLQSSLFGSVKKEKATTTDSSVSGVTSEDSLDEDEMFRSIEDIPIDMISPEPACGDLYASDSDSYSYHSQSRSFDESNPYESSSGLVTRSRSSSLTSSIGWDNRASFPSTSLPDAVLDEDKPRVKRRYRYRKSLVPNSNQIEALKLTDDSNDITFEMTGFPALALELFVWPQSSKIVVFNIDGAIVATKKSSALWGSYLLGASTRYEVVEGVSELLENIVRNGYRVLYISSNSLTSLISKKDFVITLNGIKTQIPPGPIFQSPDTLVHAFGAESSYVFKAAALRGVNNLFSDDYNPFYAAFGASPCDALAFSRCEIPDGRIYMVTGTGKVKNLNRLFQRTYSRINEDIEEWFPKCVHSKVPSVVGLTSLQSSTSSPVSAATPVTTPFVPLSMGINKHHLEDSYNDFNFWKTTPNAIID